MIDNEVPAADRQSRGWRNSLDCSAKSTAIVKDDEQRRQKCDDHVANELLEKYPSKWPFDVKYDGVTREFRYDCDVCR